MGKISKVYYEKIDKNVLPANRVARFYFLHNLFNIDQNIQDEYEMYQEFQIKLRNDIVGHAKNDKYIPGRPLLDSTIMGISGIHDSTVLIVEYEHKED